MEETDTFSVTYSVHIKNQEQKVIDILYFNNYDEAVKYIRNYNVPDWYIEGPYKT